MVRGKVGVCGRWGGERGMEVHAEGRQASDPRTAAVSSLLAPVSREALYPHAGSEQLWFSTNEIHHGQLP